ncbi:hypothetical protein L9F63_026612, partial [Diploptera punctata]
QIANLPVVLKTNNTLKFNITSNTTSDILMNNQMAPSRLITGKKEEKLTVVKTADDDDKVSPILQIMKNKQYQERMWVQLIRIKLI